VVLCGAARAGAASGMNDKAVLAATMQRNRRFEEIMFLQTRPSRRSVHRLSRPVGRLQCVGAAEPAGVGTDVAVKIYGDDSDVLEREAAQAKAILEKQPGTEGVEFETSGRPMAIARGAGAEVPRRLATVVSAASSPRRC
jgi:hypothetical protein